MVVVTTFSSKKHGAVIGNGGPVAFPVTLCALAESFMSVLSLPDSGDDAVDEKR